MPLAVLLIAFALFNGLLPALGHGAHPAGAAAACYPYLGLAWILVSLGMFLRDVGRTIGLVTTRHAVSCTPFFLPHNSAAGRIPPWLMANPLIEQSREMLIWGQLPDWAGPGHMYPGPPPPWLGPATSGPRKPEKGLPMPSKDEILHPREGQGGCEGRLKRLCHPTSKTPASAIGIQDARPINFQAER